MSNDAPPPDVVEVSLFGPGKGESCAVHIGDGDWLVIDSCVDQKTRRNAVLAYFEQIEVDVSVQVRLVVATHAHDDHFAGISEIFAAAQRAYLVCPQALSKVEFLTLVLNDSKFNGSLKKRAFAEYSRLFELAKSRKFTSDGLKPLRYAGENRILFNEKGRLVRALSPSDEAMTRAAATIYKELIDDGEPGVSQLDPNELSVALWVEAGGTSILLGADLTNGPARCGWEAVMGSFQPRPDLPATLLKVPHHGAPEAHHSEMWRELLSPEPVALLAPFRPSRNPRPNPDDLARISNVAGSVHLTAPTRRPAPSKAVTRSAQTMRTLASSVQEKWGSVGQVRARLPLGAAEWIVETVPPAFRHK